MKTEMELKRLLVGMMTEISSPKVEDRIKQEAWKVVDVLSYALDMPHHFGPTAKEVKARLNHVPDEEIEVIIKELSEARREECIVTTLASVDRVSNKLIEQYPDRAEEIRADMERTKADIREGKI